MARGQKQPNNADKERARALLLTDTVASVARQLGRPWSTIKDWKREFERDDSFVKLREKRKEKFVNDAWNLIDMSRRIIERRLVRALEGEEILDELCEEILEDVTPEKKKAIRDKFTALKLENIKDVAVVLGTIYDKQALANKEPTSIVDGEVAVKKFEDL